jgi:hypothetical protein
VDAAAGRGAKTSDDFLGMRTLSMSEMKDDTVRA